MEKNLKYYMNLPYKIEVDPIPKSEGGGYIAYLPEIGRFALVGDGNTSKAAIKNLNEIKKIVFKGWIEHNISIPEPEIERHKRKKHNMNKKKYLKPGDLVIADSVILMYDGTKYILAADGLACANMFVLEGDQEREVKYEITDKDFKPYYNYKN